MYLSGYKYRLVTWSNSIMPEGLYEEFDHVPTGIYIPIDTLKWYLITHIYIWFIDDVLSINNHNFHNYVHLIYPDELEIKDTTESDKSASYLDILLNINSNGRLSTLLYDKHDDFDFAIVNFPFLCSNIPLSSAYGVYISQLIRYARACFAYEDFSKRGKLLLMF